MAFVPLWSFQQSPRSTTILPRISTQPSTTFLHCATVRAARPLFTRYLYLRAEVTHRLLGVGLTVVFAEMDVFWLTTRTKSPRSDVDLQASEQGLSQGRPHTAAST